MEYQICETSVVSTVSVTTVRLPQDHSVTDTDPPISSQTRSSSLLHKNIISRMRPLPFQYVFSMWHTRSSTPSQPSQLAESIPNIAAFYRAFNNFPWDNLQTKDSVHFFRSGVRPLWKDPENVNGGCWVLKVRRADGKTLKTWEELCLLVCGGELQAAVAREGDHILGISFSPRLYYAHISIWTKYGDNQSSIKVLQRTAISRLSEDLRPTNELNHIYRKHSDQDGWQQA